MPALPGVLKMPAVHCKDFVGTKEAAEMLQVSVATVQKMVGRGDLDAWRTDGGHRRIPIESIIKYSRARTKEPAIVNKPLKILLIEPNPAIAKGIKKLLASGDRLLSLQQPKVRWTLLFA